MLVKCVGKQGQHQRSSIDCASCLLTLQTGQAQQTREVTAELGCVTPYIVCPGQWSQSDLEYHASTVAAGVTHNAGHNCLKAEVLVLDRDWPQREAFLAALRCAMHLSPVENPSKPIVKF